MFNKKKRLGIQPKSRTLEEINGEFSQACGQIGVGTCDIETLRLEILRLEALVANNKEKVLALKKEAAAIAGPQIAPAQPAPVADEAEHA